MSAPALWAQIRRPYSAGSSKPAAAAVMPAEVKPDDKDKPGDEKKSDKPGEKDKDKDKPGDKDEKSGEKKEETPKPIQRPTTPSKPANPEELKVRPDRSGKVKFNFTGQPWPDVLQWLADISGMSLDWQELPSDYLNLVTQRSYTVDESRELISRHLLARGYTMLRHGEVLSIVNLKKLDPSMVPRVEPKELASRDPSEFVRVSFALDWLLAETAVEELKPLLSPNGKLTALPATNRLEALDAVANLRGIQAILSEEQSPDGQQRLVREFVLQYARATEVIEQLQMLVGVEPKSAASKGPASPDQMQQQMQQMQQMIAQAQAQAQGQQGGKSAAPPKPKAEIHLVANARSNSIVAHAPADKMAIIAEAVKKLDVPTGGPHSPLAGVTRMQVYRLNMIDPEALAKTLQEIGNFDPSTRLQVDKANRSIIAYAPLADHVTIRSIVDKLDGTGRKFEVIQLRRLEADYVAGSVSFMMTGVKEKPAQRRSWWDWGGSSRQPEEKPPEFRVDADVEHNRLLLWANELEIAEVQKLLVKLGEISPEGGSASTVRSMDAGSSREIEQWLDRVRRAWPSIAPNLLVMPPPEEDGSQPGDKRGTKQPGPSAPDRSTKPAPDDRAPKSDSPPAKRAASAVTDEPRTAARGPWQPYLRLAELRSEDRAVPALAADDKVSRAAQTEPQRAAAPAPVTISRTADGRLVISSSDTQALDKLEELMNQLAPPGRVDYKIVRLKYAWATGVASTLRDIFKDEDKKKSFNPFFDYYPPPSEEPEKAPLRLSRRRPLKIVSDSETNSILVQGADPSQMKKIEELIEFYDQPQQTDAKLVRKTQTFRLRNAKAKVVAETIKEVYRDLLSANDKALASSEKRPERSTTIIFDMGEGPNKEQRAPTFKGLLSIGVDDYSNSLILSAPSFLFEDISRLIEELDRAAEPMYTTTEVVRLNHGASAAQVHEALNRAYGGRAGPTKPAVVKPNLVPPPSQQSKPEAQKSGGIQGQTGDATHAGRAEPGR